VGLRAFIITVDAIIAVGFFIVAMTLLSSQTFQPVAPRGVYLKQFTLDTLNVMDETGALGNALTGNSTPMHKILQNTPELACMQVSLIDETGTTLATITKITCGEFGRELQTTAKPFLLEGNRYIVRAESWYRKESG
jgi:hypothetical protein